MHPQKPRRHHIPQRSILEAVEAYLAENGANDDCDAPDVDDAWLGLSVRDHAWRLYERREWALLGQLMATLPTSTQDRLAQEIDQGLAKAR